MNWDGQNYNIFPNLKKKSLPGSRDSTLIERGKGIISKPF
jgi:hypothetical protein